MKPSALYPYFIFLSLFTLVTLFVYFPFVWLVFVFTDPADGFTGGDVPYYAGASLTSFWFNPNRYGWQWWWTALDITRFIPPFLLPFALVTGFLYGNKGAFWLYQVVIWVLIVLELINAIIRIVVGFIMCDSLALCHGFAQDALSTPNYSYIVFACSTLIYIILWSVYLCAINSAKHAYSDMPRGASDPEYGEGELLYGRPEMRFYREELRDRPVYYQTSYSPPQPPPPYPQPPPLPPYDPAPLHPHPPSRMPSRSEGGVYAEGKLARLGKVPVPLRVSRPSLPRFPLVVPQKRM